MKTENLQPPDEPRMITCPECNGTGSTTIQGIEPVCCGDFKDDDCCGCPEARLVLLPECCPACCGQGEILEEDPRYYFDELKADDEDRGKHSELKKTNDE